MTLTPDVTKDVYDFILQKLIFACGIVGSTAHPPAQAGVEQAGPQLPGHGGDGRVRGDHPGREGALHSSRPPQQSPRLRQRHCMGSTQVSAKETHPVTRYFYRSMGPPMYVSCSPGSKATITPSRDVPGKVLMKQI